MMTTIVLDVDIVQRNIERVLVKAKRSILVMGGYTVDGSGADCKSAIERFGWFDSISAHHIRVYVSGIPPVLDTGSRWFESSHPDHIICPGCLGSLPNEEFESLTDVK